MENFTGLNADLAKKQIEDFWAQGIRIAGDYNDRMKGFYNALFYSWCSPKAVEFGKNQMPKLFAVYWRIDNTLCDICDDAEDAYNNLAQGNGLPPIPIEQDRDFRYDIADMEASANYPFDEVDANGNTGMEHKTVLDAIENLKINVSNLCQGLETLPMDIAFYDPNDALKSAYKARINTLIDTITEIANNASNELTSALASEVDTVIASVQQAQSSISA